jgi:hypothetical protein
VTRSEFEGLMESEEWSPQKRARWSGITPKSDAETFRKEIGRIDGLVEVEKVLMPRSLKDWLRPFGFR